MIKHFYKPESISEAVKLLKKEKNSAPLAGGTFLTQHVPKKISSLVDLSNLNLNYVRKKNNSLFIGATTTFAEIAEANSFPQLSEITGNTATEPLRNMITAGGNVMIPLRWSDLPIVLFVLDADFVLQSSRERVIPANDFFKTLPAKILKAGEFLKEIVISDFSKTKIAKKKIIRAYDDMPALQTAVALRLKRKKIDFIKLAFVANKPLPTRLEKAENFLLNKIPDDDLIEQAAEIAAAESPALNDIRFSNNYLNEMIRVHTRRLIHQCLEQK